MAEVEYEVVGHPFPTQFAQFCRVNYTHKIKRGDMVAKIQRADNPMLPVTGVACKVCVRLMSS